MELMLCIGMVLVCMALILVERRLSYVIKTIVKMAKLEFDFFTDVNEDRKNTLKLIDHVIELTDKQDHDHKCLSTLWDKVYRKIKVVKLRGQGVGNKK